MIDTRTDKLLPVAGWTLRKAAGILGVSASTAEHAWVYAKAWLSREMARP